MTRIHGVTRDEILEVRSRLGSLPRWDVARLEVNFRLFDLKKYVGSPAGDDMHRHVVVSAVAALQTFHRATLVEITNAGEEYKKRAAETVKEKVVIRDALLWLSDKTVTFGELIAHVSPCSEVTELVATLGQLLNCDLKQMLASARSATSSDDSTLIVSDVDALFSQLSQLFRLRHIFAHEVAPEIVVTAPDCDKLIESVHTWTMGIEAILWETIYAGQPRSQSEMNEHAYHRIRGARKELAAEMWNARAFAREDGTTRWLRLNHRAWVSVTKDWTANTFSKMDGSMWPAVSGSDRAQTIEARSKQVARWTRWRTPESPDS